MTRGDHPHSLALLPPQRPFLSIRRDPSDRSLRPAGDAKRAETARQWIGRSKAGRTPRSFCKGAKSPGNKPGNFDQLRPQNGRTKGRSHGRPRAQSASSGAAARNADPPSLPRGLPAHRTSVGRAILTVPPTSPHPIRSKRATKPRRGFTPAWNDQAKVTPVATAARDAGDDARAATAADATGIARLLTTSSTSPTN